MPGVYNGTHQRQRQAALKALIDGTPCPLCGRAMYRSQKLQYHHLHRLVDGGDPNGPKALAHAYCNQADNAHRGEVRFPKPRESPKEDMPTTPRRKKGFKPTCPAGVSKVVRRKGLCLRDIAKCDHDPRRCEHVGSAIWDSCEECKRYSWMILEHVPCLAEGGEVAEWYTVDGLPAWVIPSEGETVDDLLAEHVAETRCPLHG